MIGAAGPHVLNFCASWAEPCAHLNVVFAELASEHGKHLTFVQLDADAFPELCERFNLESVPAFLFLQGGSLIDSVMGADAPALHNKVKQHALSASIAAPDGAVAPPPPPKTATDAAAATARAVRASVGRALAHSDAPGAGDALHEGHARDARCGLSQQRSAVAGEGALRDV